MASVNPPTGPALPLWALFAFMASWLFRSGANAPETPVRNSLKGRAWLQKAETIRWRNRVIDRMTDAWIQFTGACKVDA